MASTRTPAGTPLTCPDCRASYLVDDNYCRQCGMYVAALRSTSMVATPPGGTIAPVPRAVTRPRPALPGPVKKTATAIAIGGALQIGLGVAARMMAGQTARKVARTALISAATRGRTPARTAVPETKAVSVAPADGPGASLVDELVVVRRVWLRRS